MTFVREYWYCPSCGTGYAPFDAQAQIPPGQISYTVQLQLGKLGALLPFRRAVDVYDDLTGLRVSARQGETITEAIGQAYTPPVLERYTPGPRVDTLFVEADACMVKFTDGWHEVKSVICWGRVNGEDLPPRYLATEGTWEDLGPAIYALARRQGVRQASQVVCLADGARSIWKVLSRLFPDALELVDWFHVQQHLAEVAAVVPDGPVWHKAQRDALIARGPAETLATLQALAQGEEGAKPTALQTAAQACYNYLWGHRDRLDYPRADARGYPIGSGRIESTCGYLVEQRLKLSGMEWKHAHAMQVLKARTAILNEDWDLVRQQYIQQSRAKAA